MRERQFRNRKPTHSRGAQHGTNHPHSLPLTRRSRTHSSDNSSKPLWFDPYLGEDMTAGPDETRARITDFYGRARAAADRVLTELPLDTVGKPAWRDDECSLRWVLVRMTAETARHAGHMDIVRELIDGGTGEYRPS
ncbi:mycothiol transferase [Streptomyces sp. B21-083]|uniref:mycothiol transferase n=1 Tax=Streptomyces sp. B21-083 TaxID=3039410 RepID=UPI002FF29060